jgi:hypothetical protein
MLKKALMDHGTLGGLLLKGIVVLRILKIMLPHLFKALRFLKCDHVNAPQRNVVGKQLAPVVHDKAGPAGNPDGASIAQEFIPVGIGHGSITSEPKNTGPRIPDTLVGIYFEKTLSLNGQIQRISGLSQSSLAEINIQCIDPGLGNHRVRTNLLIFEGVTKRHGDPFVSGRVDVRQIIGDQVEALGLGRAPENRAVYC